MYSSLTPLTLSVQHISTIVTIITIILAMFCTEWEELSLSLSILATYTSFQSKGLLFTCLLAADLTYIQDSKHKH